MCTEAAKANGMALLWAATLEAMLGAIGTCGLQCWVGCNVGCQWHLWAATLEAMLSGLCKLTQMDIMLISTCITVLANRL